MAKKMIIKKNQGTCPDCGFGSASYEIKPATHGNGNFVRISCPKCHYYEFVFDAKDE